MDNLHLWELTQETHRAIAPTYEPIFDQFSAETGLDGGVASLLLAAFTIEPQTISPDRLLVRGPYTAPSAYQAKLAAAAGAGLLAEEKPCEYRLTMRGQLEVIRLLKDARAAMAESDPLPLVASQRLAALLEKLVEASREAPPPPGRWSVCLGYKLMPAASPPLPYTEQAISCLNGYRDDAHLAAWGDSGLSAPALETLTLLWREEESSLDGVTQRLRHRGHPPLAYARAFEELRRNGYLEGPDDAPVVTELGRTFRAQVEHQTNRYFFAPWDCLIPDEKTKLENLLVRLRDSLNAGALG